MISIINGRVIDLEKDQIVVDVGGVGLQVFVPAHLRSRLHSGESVFLFTHLVVREDALTLFGFETKESREFFNLLLGVSGVGPRLALSILSALDPEAIRRAVFHEQAEVFARVPGIGKKTAQKILLHLQDKVVTSPGLEPVAVMSEADAEVLAALTSLGYSVVEAQSALQNIPANAPQEVETRLRLALQYFTTP
jgi:Holliday junction DNA helicase RuvA